MLTFARNGFLAITAAAAEWGGGGLYYTGQSFQAKVGTLQYCGTVYSNEVQDGCSRSLLGLVMTAETRWPSCPTCYTPLKSA